MSNQPTRAFRVTRCIFCARQLPHPPRVKIRLPGLTAWLARKAA